LIDQQFDGSKAMNRRDFHKILGAAAIVPAGLAQSSGAMAQSAWSLTANLAECCSCEIPCPCNFGLPTKNRCDGNRLIEITEGHLGDDDLAGLRFLVTFEMGQWSRIYVDDALGDAQFATLEKVLPLAFGWFHQQARTIERVPMSVTRGSDAITYTTPDSAVEMKPLAGLDGKRISIDGLPSNAFHDYVQYESVRHVHNGPDRQWSHSGTNGFTSRMIASG
jgi:hypothetical protein